MPPIGLDSINNRLLLALPRASFDLLRPALQPVGLVRGQAIDHPDGPIEYLYFVNRGFVSMVKTMHDGRSVEVGGVGVEGVTDPNSLFGFSSAVLDTVVQIAGDAFRVKREFLKAKIDQDPALRRTVQTHARFVLSQLAQTAACNRLHSLEERCCRWLLTAHDNALSDRFSLTHEFLAMMLGVQRTGVSIAARMLKKAGMIDYVRGEVTILDRAALQETSCECYRTLRDELNILFPPAGAARRI